MDIIEPLATKAKERNEEFQEEYVKMINKMTLEFATQYCDAKGNIKWNKIVELNSASNRLNK